MVKAGVGSGMREIAEQWRELCAEEPMIAQYVRNNEDLSRKVTFRIGGTARHFIVPPDHHELSSLIAAFSRHGLPWKLIGGGSNLLVEERTIEEPVVSIERCASTVEIVGDRLRSSGARGASRSTRVVRLRVGGGVRLKKLLARCIREGWSGGEFLAGIPATIGGAVFMNAGTPAGSMADIVQRVELVDHRGAPYTSPLAAFSPRYRASGIPRGHVVIAVEMELVVDTPLTVHARTRDTIMRRNATQPRHLPSAGCIFRNPSQGLPPAGWLIEQCGLKGYREGAAQISPLHANWIVNLGGATAQHVERLIELAKEKVQHRFGITLEEEIERW